MAASLSTEEIARELAAYAVELSPRGLNQLSAYLDLLLRWNRKINLTALREPRQIVRRLFGESLYLSEVLDLRGWLVDVGSGAGFPGLALKLAAPDLQVTLVESRKKKCAFLKEVARECQFINVAVVDERFETWAGGLSSDQRPSVITTRAVKAQPKLLEAMRKALAPRGKGVFLTTNSAAGRIQRAAPGWKWQVRLQVPGGEQTIVLVGESKILCV